MILFSFYRYWEGGECVPQLGVRTGKLRDHIPHSFDWILYIPPQIDICR